ncbi:hypothetical protein BC830DRAFT_174030 [Chytriomyces sp. MP71]|nr:hypothetical protein BC830DRAFT_174030 [Chytriomyces sp. MP71]
MLQCVQVIPVNPSTSMNLPENLVANLASTSPSISRFDLRYLSLAPNHVFDIASHLTNLQHLRLQECDAWFYPSENATTISYVLLVKFLTSHLPSLQALELDQCTLNSMDDSNHAMVCRPTIVHGLKSLQIFDLKSQLSTADIHELLFFLENLVSLRLDVIGDVFYDDVIFSRLRISELELRGAVSKGEYNNVVAKISQEPPGSLLKLDVLSLWSAPPLLVQALITSPLNMQNLKRLTINYCFSDSNIDNISLPSLEHLEVKAIGAFAHLTSANAVIALASGSKKLKHLDIGAFRKDSGDLPMSIIQFVAKCVDLRSLKLTNFTVKAKSMQWLCNACRALTLFEITGCQAFSFLNSKDEQMWLVPFLQSHRMMKSFKINVGGIDIGQHRVGEPFVDASLGLMVEGVGFQARSAVVRETRLADMAVYKQYSSDLKKRFWWIETLSIVGPLGGMSFIRE